MARTKEFCFERFEDLILGCRNFELERCGMERGKNGCLRFIGGYTTQL